MIGKDPNAPPLPKGKVRQLWPPPDPAETAEDLVRAPESTSRPASSLFVSDEDEREARRQRARERAEAREEFGHPQGQPEPSSPDGYDATESPAMIETFPQWEPGEETPLEFERDEDSES
jgi:hypothetical protein